MRGVPRWRALPIAAVFLGLAQRPAFAQAIAKPPVGTAASESSASARDEARRRFDRGLALYNHGDLAGALAEFRLAYKLSSHPVVLYNLALTEASLGLSADAVAALERLLSESAAELDPTRLARARAVYEDQLKRLGTLEIRSELTGVRVDLDGREVARTPAQPLRVTAGVHVLSLSREGYEPRHVSVIVAGGALEVVDAGLVALEGPPSRVRFGCRTPDVLVRANGQPLGKTPFSGELSLKAGSYDIEFTRDGYLPVRRHVLLAPGGAQGVEVDLFPSDEGLRAGGTLLLSVSESNAVVFVDGNPMRGSAAGIRLPAGRHALRVERTGFFEVVRDVFIRPGPNAIEVTLLPTPSYLNQYVDAATTRRTASYVTLGAGAAVVAASAGFLIWNQGEKNQAEQEFEDFAAEVEQTPEGRCVSDSCEKTLDILLDDLDKARSRDVFGFVGVGVGLASLGVGLFLYLGGDDPGRYDPGEDSDVFKGARLRLAPGGLRVEGAF